MVIQPIPLPHAPTAAADAESTAPEVKETAVGDIGEDQREYEFEPLTAPSVPEPAPTPLPEPAEPEKVPA